MKNVKCKQNLCKTTNNIHFIFLFYPKVAYLRLFSFTFRSPNDLNSAGSGHFQFMLKASKSLFLSTTLYILLMDIIEN